MKLRSTMPSGLAVAAVIAVGSALTSCGQATQAPEQPTAIAKENAKMRSEVPLTRPLDLSQSGDIVNLEFNLPPPGPNAAPNLMLGMRIVRPDAESVIALSDAIRSGLDGRVSLVRIEGAKDTLVMLVRSSRDLRERLPIAEDGAFPGITTAGVDTSSLQDAGLTEAGTSSEVLMFAAAENIAPGRYRLVVNLPQPHPQFRGESMELLVAYFGKGK